jgi:hypothetical protein
MARTVLMVSENKALMRIFGPTKDEVTGKWRKLKEEDIYNL